VSRFSHIIIPNRDISIQELNGECWYIIQKICDVIFTEDYNDFSINVCRVVLNGIIKYKQITWKQAKLVMDLKPKK